MTSVAIALTSPFVGCAVVEVALYTPLSLAATITISPVGKVTITVAPGSVVPFTSTRLFFNSVVVVITIVGTFVGTVTPIIASEHIAPSFRFTIAVLETALAVEELKTSIL